MLQKMREYQGFESKDLRIIGKRTEDGIESQLLVIQTPFGYRRIVEQFRPTDEGSFAGILYSHWYEPGSPDSNRSQFVEEAKEMARAGAVCLLIETLWSDSDFFLKRTQDDDLQNSVEEVVNTRRAMDLLLSQPNVDSKRFAYVGHDFGGMYGVLAGSLDQRPTHYVVLAATPRFPDWYLYSPKLEGEAREAFIRQMSEIDPIAHAPNLSPAEIFFQFGTNDPHVPKERAEEFFASAKFPKEMKWYESGHGLNEAAANDRKIWLKQKLNLS
ncbi:MAG: dienelactone hydrolase family protein [Anaerolineae bacterium]|nr:dienelactone hydrolase family protein [Anaerolineae bacterium]MCI0610654.1 dienelactone hydrolase family protein [Anaerolineae bacterium]